MANVNLHLNEVHGFDTQGFREITVNNSEVEYTGSLVGTRRGFFYIPTKLYHGVWEVNWIDFHGVQHSIPVHLPTEATESQNYQTWSMFIYPHPNGEFFALTYSGNALFYNLRGELLLNLRECLEGQAGDIYPESRCFDPLEVEYLEPNYTLIFLKRSMNRPVILKDLQLYRIGRSEVLDMSLDACWSPSMFSNGDFLTLHRCSGVYKIFSPSKDQPSREVLKTKGGVDSRLVLDYFDRCLISNRVYGGDQDHLTAKILEGPEMYIDLEKWCSSFEIFRGYTKVIDSITEEVGIIPQESNRIYQIVTPHYLIFFSHDLERYDGCLFVVVDRKTRVSFYQYFERECGRGYITFAGCMVRGTEIHLSICQHEELGLYERSSSGGYGYRFPGHPKSYRLWSFSPAHIWTPEVLRSMSSELRERQGMVYRCLRACSNLPGELINLILREVHCLEHFG